MEDSWKEYEHLSELYKSYLSIMVNLGVFSFAAIGGVTSFVLTDNLNAETYLSWAVLMPLMLSLGLCFLYLKSIKPAKELEAALNKIGYQSLNVELVPHAYLLVYGVRLFALLYSAISLGLIILVVSLVVVA